MQPQQTQTHILIPTLYSEQTDATTLLSGLLQDASLMQGKEHMLAERVWTLQQFCVPQSPAWNECEKKLTELHNQFQNTNQNLQVIPHAWNSPSVS